MKFVSSQRKYAPARRIARFVLFIVVLCSVGVVVYNLPTFRVTDITCTVASGDVCPEGILEEFEQYKGKSMFTVKTEVSEKKIHSALTYVQDLSVTRTLPRKLDIFITYREPAYYAQNDAGGAIYAVDDHGRVYSKVSDGGTHIVVLFDPSLEIRIGTALSEDSQALFSLLTQRLQSFPSLVTSIRYVSSHEIIISLEDGTRGILQSEDALAQLDTLQRILNDVTIETQSKTIDVRFSHPVIQ